MKNQTRSIEFTSVKMGANIKFRVEVKVKESFLQRLTNVFKPTKIVTTWMEESQASSTSNYLYNEIKKLKKSFVVKNDEPKAEVSFTNIKEEAEDAVITEKDDFSEKNKSKSKRKYSRKPSK